MFHVQDLQLGFFFLRNKHKHIKGEGMDNTLSAFNNIIN